MIDVVAAAGAADSFRGSAVPVAAGAFLSEVHLNLRLRPSEDAFPTNFFSYFGWHTYHLVNQGMHSKSI
jgi:hypothetical protein